MRKIGKYFMISFLLLGGVSGCHRRSSEETKQIYGCDSISVFNAGEYIDPTANDIFERTFGATVIYDTYDSNEAAYLKMTTNSYDVVIVSDYMIERLRLEDRLQPIDSSYMTNFESLDDKVLGWAFDPNNEYSIPYFWGTVGIVYNKNTVAIEDVKEEGFGIFQNTAYQGEMFLYDSERDAFMMALKQLGYSMNTKNPVELQEAYEWLLAVKKENQPSIVTDEVIDALANGEKDFALMYSGDAAYVLSENENMDYYIPEEGTNYWVDAMVIPKDANCSTLANEYINFMIGFEAASFNSEFVGYTSSNQKVVEELSGEGGYYMGNAAYVPPPMSAKDETFHYDGEVKKIISEYWVKIKASK